MHVIRVSLTKGSSAMLSRTAISNYLPKFVIRQICKKNPKDNPKHGHKSKNTKTKRKNNISMEVIRMRAH